MADFGDREELRRGAGGVVYVGTLVENGEQLKFAIKIPSLDPEMEQKEKKYHAAAKNIAIERTVREGKSRVLADHDNIVHFFGAIPEKPGSAQQAFVFELCAGDMSGLIRERVRAKCHFFDEEDIMIVASDLLCALNDLHEAGWVHFDVALSNLLHHEPDGKVRLKLADFGLAKEFQGPGASSILTVVKQTHLDTAPEARKKDAHVDAQNAPQLDAW